MPNIEEIFGGEITVPADGKFGELYLITLNSC